VHDGRRNRRTPRHASAAAAPLAVSHSPGDSLETPSRDTYDLTNFLKHVTVAETHHVHWQTASESLANLNRQVAV
jgi:molybdopterin-guanine dinucleotide biosynthesis protein